MILIIASVPIIYDAIHLTEYVWSLLIKIQKELENIIVKQVPRALP